MEHVLRILFTRAGPRRYETHVTRSPSGVTPSGVFEPPPDLEFQRVQDQMLNWRSAANVPPVESPRTPKAIGVALYQALFRGAVHNAFIVSRNEARAAGTTLQLQLQLTRVPELALLPWEFLFDESENEFLGCSRDVTVVRYLSLPRPRSPFGLLPPLRMLLMIALPAGVPELKAVKEVERLRGALKGLTHTGLLQVDPIGGTLEELSHALIPDREKYHAFHFIGHGRTADNGEGALLLAGSDGGPLELKAAQLADLLGKHRSMRLAVLNSCEGARGSRTDPFSGTAQALVQRGIPAVVGMQCPISDDAAIAFSSAFYAALAQHRPVDEAVDQGRAAIRNAAAGTSEWGTPVLYLESRTPFIAAPPWTTRLLKRAAAGQTLVDTLRLAQPGDRTATRAWGTAIAAVTFAATALVLVDVYRFSFNLDVVPLLDRALRQREGVIATAAAAVVGAALFAALQRWRWLSRISLTADGFPSTGRLGLGAFVLGGAIAVFGMIPPVITLTTCPGAVPDDVNEGWDPRIAFRTDGEVERVYQQVGWYIARNYAPDTLRLKITLDPADTINFDLVHSAESAARAPSHACNDPATPCVLNDLNSPVLITPGLVFGVMSETTPEKRKAHLDHVTTTIQILDEQGRERGLARFRRPPHFKGDGEFAARGCVRAVPAA